MGYIGGMDPRLLQALAEPNRLRIVELLQEQPRSVNDIAQALSMHQPQVSKHLHTLSAAGFVQVRPAAQRRIYALQSKPFEQLDAWLQRFARHQHRQLDKLEVYLRKVERK